MSKFTYPEDTNRVERTERLSVWLDHAPHTVELPSEEEDDKQMVRIPKPLKIGTAPFLHGEPDHDTQCNSHDPTRSTGTGGKICLQENKHTLASCICVWISEGKLVKVVHVSTDVD